MIFWDNLTSHDDCQLPVSPVNHGQNTVSKTGDILSKVHESCLEDISGTAEILQIEGELDVSISMVEYSGTPEIEGKILNCNFLCAGHPLGYRICCYRSIIKL